MNNVFAMIMAVLIGFAVAALLGFVLIPWLHKLKFGQTILDIGPRWHKNKQGTPTMGGIMFIAATVGAIVVVFATDKIMGGDLIGGNNLQKNIFYTRFWSGIIMALGFAFVGFIDDYIKVVKRRNLGLTVIQKTAVQLALCIGYLWSMYMSGDTMMFVPFVGRVPMGWFYWIFGICVIYGAINAVNFTDGIDGLCSSVTITAAAAFIVIAFMRKNMGAGLLSSALMGGCAGFLMWNKNPAKVFMGDTGSMFLGGMVVAISYALECPLILLLTGIVYVIEALSDVIQIGYFKLTHGKRVFKMAPIHHHFEMSGWKEKKIVAVFSFVNLLGGLAAILVMYYG
ncbi:MAG: phospho-N-acetylmuramoyl-pentapeptide-transferase [Ruminococcaceae bacterium]|nr:phospho-N-acetylmuramoyl-pentapeptide-transferase [Oscillospiraceae bacterium]